MLMRCINKLESQESEQEPANTFYRSPKAQVAVDQLTVAFSRASDARVSTSDKSASVRCHSELTRVTSCLN